MAFLSGLGRTYFSPGLFRMTRAILFILGIFVCLAPILEVNSTQALYNKDRSLKDELYQTLKEFTTQIRLHYVVLEELFTIWMTRTVLSILVMFVCLAPMQEVYSTQDDIKKKIQALELKANSLKDYCNTKKEAIFKMLEKDDQSLDAALAKAEKREGPVFAAIKDKLEMAKESNSERKAQLQHFTHVCDLSCEHIQKEIMRLKDLVNEPEVIKNVL
ncbi:uncharacterized protein LOC130370185 isoform X1 [Gadus chalcogrammus]|uniref:uncharacterized protein LOC130370185 isoform X1 n=2 Tax=Gadus chalcogrammus TaxID=1042646 RepID=UPI0024C476A5|nr:uncharacterized protein LOC130370185 isoform X1 [Gadus chalcogrammus]